ncbi:hypothetical protein SAMN05444000_11872 [Shimia gijangensis]|uniref:Uncharacterized protein n=1 Tax=Shimia gijangensis TaxID=1470563 RepID=A0A1M6PK79_9RHOB|nr:hypothetical protein [Shimia gijangensis]SHK08392.1 hypothetical protein SAMN05444000_11872 [Shimia gijangensis]
MMPLQLLNRVKMRLVGSMLAASILTSQAVAMDILELPQQFQEKITLAKKECAEFSDGEFYIDWGAVNRVDLDGDMRFDWVLNEFGFACSSAASLYHGTGGSVSHFLVADNLSSLLNQGWSIISLGPHRVLLADVHGSQCGGINPTPCVTSSIWDNEEMLWRSTSAEWE